jgi:RNAse (barnase) inhibitor barstar
MFAKAVLYNTHRSLTNYYVCATHVLSNSDALYSWVENKFYAPICLEIKLLQTRAQARRSSYKPLSKCLQIIKVRLG